MNIKLKNLFFILILGSVSTSLLVGIKEYTFPKIERYHDFRLKSTILDAAEIGYHNDNIDNVFRTNIRRIERDGFIYYVDPRNFYIFIFKGRGLWGMIEGVIALRPDLKTIENIKIISQEETPGLGGRITEKKFLDQFRRKETLPKLIIVLRKKASAVNEVDAITGASMTSKALVDMINQSVLDFRKKVGEEKSIKNSKSETLNSK